MKKNRNIKNIIKKRIEIRNGEKTILKPDLSKQSNKIARSNVVNPKTISTPTINTTNIPPNKTIKIVDNNPRFNIKPPNNLTKHEQRDYERTGVVSRNFSDKYIKDDDVKYDINIIISSYNRFAKVKSLINQFYTQETKYKFKIVLLDDGSTYWKYKKFNDYFSDLVCLKNENNGGKRGYWRSINKLFDYCKENKSHMILQIDDDYVICENYLNIIGDQFFSLKNEDNRYVGISYHRTHEKVPKQWGMDHWVDGGTLFDYKFIKKLNFKIDDIPDNRWDSNSELSSGVWNQVSKKITSMKLYIYKTKQSLVRHNGNEDSKMNKSQRDKSPIHTWNFIDNKI